MDDAPTPEIEPANLKFLRVLVTVLTGTMIVGLLVIIALIVIRFTNDTSITVPDVITLPDGTTATAFTQGVNFYAVVTADQTILIFDRATGALKQTVALQN